MATDSNSMKSCQAGDVDKGLEWLQRGENAGLPLQLQRFFFFELSSCDPNPRNSLQKAVAGLQMATDVKKGFG